jgi:uncharacterized delta-60 repeat protein
MNPGTLDTTFGTNGKIILTDVYPLATIIQPDGKVIVATFSSSNEIASIRRYNTNNSLDTTFGSNGNFNVNRRGLTFSMRLMGDGSFLVVQEVPTPASTQFPFATVAPFEIKKYNSNGALDTSFGSNGTLVSINSFSNISSKNVFALGNKIFIGGLGRLVGSTSNPTGKIEAYNSDGSIDTSFGNSGIINTSIIGITTATLQSDGKILVAGGSQIVNNQTQGNSVVRLLPNGTVDKSFNTSFLVNPSVFVNQLLQQSDGKIVVQQGNSIYRLNSNGSVDNTFSPIGLNFSPLGVIKLQNDDKILVAGSADSDFSAKRYSKNGLLDTTFGTNGSAVIDFGRLETLQQIDFIADGRLILYGTSDRVTASITFTSTVVASLFASSVNSAPVVANAIADQSTKVGTAFDLPLLANTFSDPNGDTLTYTATLADSNNSPLPSWLTFNETTKTFSGTPPTDASSLNLRVKVTDPSGLSAADEFTLTIAPANQAPIVANPIADQNATGDTDFSFTIPANSFSDPNPNDTLTYSATLADANNSRLPSWLLFNPSTKTFSGTPPVGTGSLNVRVKVTDNDRLSVTDDFTIAIPQSPVVAKAIADQPTTTGTAFSFVIPDNTFNDPDATVGSTLAYSATLANGNPLPSWLTFDTTTRTFSGTPPKGDPITVRVKATDNGGLSITDDFTIAALPPIVDAKIIKPTKIFNTGGSLYAFTSGGANIDNDKVGLWKFNSSTNEFEKFTSPLQTANSTISNVVAVGKTLYLLGSDNTGAFAYLGKLDTTTGSFSLINNVPGTQFPKLLPTDTTLYFGGFTREEGIELWKVDESTGNSVRITDIAPGRDSSNPGNPGGLIKFGDNVYFTAGNNTAGTELWKIDATGNLTQFDLAVNAGSSIPENFTDIGGTLYFTTYNSSSNSIGTRDLWRINAAGQPEKVSENISPRDDGKYFTNINGVVYFNRGFSRNLNLTLWQVSSPTVTETQVKADGVSMQQVYAVGNNTYFTGLSPLPAGGVGQVLWRRNPTNGNLVRLSDSLGTQNSSYDLFSFTDVSGITYFKRPGNFGQELWKIGKDNILSKIDLPVGTTFGAAGASIKSIEQRLYFVANQTAEATTPGAGVPVDLVLKSLDPATDRIETVANITFAQPTLELEIVGHENGRIFISGRDTTNNAVQQPMLWSIAAEPGTPFVATNEAPLLANPISTVVVNGSNQLSYIVPANTFSDPDANDVLTYSATLKDGSPLPAGLTFDPGSRTFQGTLDRNLSLKVTATDQGGFKASTDFDVRLNNPPVIGSLFFGDLREVSTLANKNFGAVLDSTISDPDGDLFTLSVSLADGSPLPTWLTFDSANRRFNGTPATQDIGQLNIRVTATDPGGLSASKDFALNIKTDRPSVKILRAAGSVFENGDKPTIVLTRDGSLNAPLTVKYSLSGTATAGVDYDNNIPYSQTVFNNISLAVDNTVTFSAGVDQMTITIPTIDDNIYEGKTAETIDFKLENDPAYDLISGTQIQQTIQIVDNENSPLISVSTPGMELDRGSAYKLSVVEGNSGIKRQIEFTAKLNNPSYEAVSVDYSIQNVTTSNDDYTSTTGTIAFAPGETEKKVSIEVIGDDRFETDEQFQVVFNNPQGDTTVSDPAGSGKQVLFNINISNDDQRPTVTIAASKNASEAGEIGEFVISRDNVGINDALVVKLETITGADFTTIFSARDTLSKLNAPLGNAGEDYEGSLPTSVTFAPGENKITLQVKAIDDRIPEDNQSVVLLIVNDVNYATGNVSASLRIIDNEIVPAALTKVQKTAAEAGYKIDKLATTEGVLSIPGNYQILDGNKVLWAEGKDVWFFDGKDKKKLDSDVLPNTIELGKNSAAWTKLGAPQNLFFFDGSSTIDLGRVTSGDGSKAFDMAGDRIAYSDGSQIKIYNINTKTTTVIPGDAAGIQLDPLGNGVAWYENPNPLAGSYYNQLKFFNGSETVNLARTNDANGARKAVVSDGKVLYTSNLYTNNRTDLYLYDGSKTIKVAEGIENSNANLNGFGIEGDRVYYQVILDDANLPDGTNKPLTALRNYSISTGKTETVFDTTETSLPFVNQLSESSSSGQYTAWNYLQNSATSVSSGIYLEDGINIIGIKDPEPAQGRNEFRPVVAADGSVVFAVYDGAKNRSDLYLVSKNASLPAINQAPTVANPVTDQTTEIGKPFTYTIPANTFSDPDAGDTLSYSVTQEDGSTLPTWLTFDVATRTLSGNSPTGSPAVDIKVTATDSGSLSASDTFRVSPTNPLTGIPGLSTIGNLFRTDSSLNGFAVNPVSQSLSQKVSEIALFAVDDLTGKIGSLNPTDAGYLAAALDRAKPIFSTLAAPFFATDKREISLNPNQIYQVIEIVDGSLAQTKQQVASGQTPSNVLFSNSGSNSPIKVIENSDNYRININSNELVLDVTELAGGIAAIPIGAKSQDLPEGRLIDLTDHAGQTLKINITNASSASYSNQVGFYEVKDLAGTITVNGQDLRPGDAGYAAAAVQSAILQTDKSGSQSNQNIIGGKIYAPVAIANGTFNSFLTNNSSNVNNPLVNDNNETFAYFNYVGANPDKIDHFRLLNNNTFGVEDIYGGGDRDFNDIKMSLTINT